MERIRPKDIYPQPVQTHRERELNNRFNALDPLVQEYIYAADGLVHAPLKRKQEERVYLVGIFTKIAKQENHEELIVQLGGFFQYRNRIRNGGR